MYAFLQGFVDKNSALSTMNREPQTNEEIQQSLKIPVVRKACPGTCI